MLKTLSILLAGLFAVAACSANSAPEAANTATGTVKATSATAKTAPRQWIAGQDYFLINPAQPTDGDTDVVTEVFSYACPHCAYFQPYAAELKSKLPAGVTFNLLPAVFSAQWEPFARAYYTAKSMGLLEKTHQALFDALHRDHEPLGTIQDLANLFYAKYGANPGEFLSTANSFVIEGEMAQGNQKVHAYQVDATPSLIVDGKYRVTANSERNIGFEEMVQIAQSLVQQELASKRGHHTQPVIK